MSPYSNTIMNDSDSYSIKTMQDVSAAFPITLCYVYLFFVTIMNNAGCKYFSSAAFPVTSCYVYLFFVTINTIMNNAGRKYISSAAFPITSTYSLSLSIPLLTMQDVSTSAVLHFQLHLLILCHYQYHYEQCRT